MAPQPFQQAGDYNEDYGFREAPFCLTPDPKFAYSSTSHERALQTILHALSRREGLIVVTGDIGCGKTTLCRRLLPLLPERTFLSLVLNPFLAADDLLKQVLQDYGLMSTEDLRRGPLARTSGHDLARTLQDFLNSLSQINGTAVIIIDEAQNLPIRTLEQIRLLSNFETDTTKLLQIILVGQRNLEPILELEELRQLNQRISRRCRIEPLSASEVAKYVEHRLSTATSGSDNRVLFQSDSLSAISRLSNGVPRIVNLLCDRTLEIGHGKQATSMDTRLVLTAAKDLELAIPAAVRFDAVVSRPLVRAVVTAGLIGTVGTAVVGNRGAFPVWPTAVKSTPQSAASEQRDPAPVVSSTSGDSRRIESEPAAPLATVVEAAPSFELTVASFQTAGRARAVAADLSGRGYPARAAASNSGRWQIVIVGPYASLMEARQVKDALESSGFSEIRMAEFE